MTVEDDDDQAVPPGRQRKIIHVDMDAFYASVEQRDNPDLRGKPVAVGSSRERGVVAAASYEARKFGVRSAMPSVTAKRQCPDLIYVKPRFEVYKAVSQQIREIFAEHTAIIEPLSLDEAYLDVTENLQGIPLARDVALAIRAKIKQETGLNASAGISYNKFLAKLASDHRKPNGQYVITPDMGPAFVENLPVGKFHDWLHRDKAGGGWVGNSNLTVTNVTTGVSLMGRSIGSHQQRWMQYSRRRPIAAPLEVCVRRPPVCAAPPSWGQHPQIRANLYNNRHRPCQALPVNPCEGPSPLPRRSSISSSVGSVHPVWAPSP